MDCQTMSVCDVTATATRCHVIPITIDTYNRYARSRRAPKPSFWDGSELILKSANLTIDSDGIRLAAATSGTIDLAKSYAWDATSGVIAMFGASVPAAGPFRAFNYLHSFVSKTNTDDVENHMTAQNTSGTASIFCEVINDVAAITMTAPTVNVSGTLAATTVNGASGTIAGSVFTTGQIVRGSAALGTGNQAGTSISIGRNTSGNGAAGYLELVAKDGTAYVIWPDAAGKLRISTAPPQEDGTPSDTSGTIVGSQ